MGKITFRYWEPSEEKLLPALFDILYTNMSSLAPTGYSYQEDLDIWLGYMCPAMKEPSRKILMMYSGEILAGYFQYSVEGDTVLIEEIQLKPEYQRTMLFYRCCQFLLKEIPDPVRYLISYVNKRNRHSISIHEKLGMERIGENRSGSSWQYRGDICKAAARFRRKGEQSVSIKLRNMTSVYFVKENGILCLYRIGSRVANNKYVGAAGGHFEKEELNDPTACILREMQEELGLSETDVEGLHLRYITHRLVGGEIRQNYYFFARIKEDKPLSSTEGNLRWVSYEEISSLEMPVSAKHMILHYVQEGRFTDKVYGGITEETGTKFVAMENFPG